MSRMSSPGKLPSALVQAPISQLTMRDELAQHPWYHTTNPVPNLRPYDSTSYGDVV
ncbi:hypothetical protein PCAR4_570007 [Paraburkholderia caribensis]|nr:hypothetical protein PCAR4_570007 [Paraburkholderia caribensis]